MKAWAKTLGTVAALGTVAPLALAALDGTVAPTEDVGTQQHGLAGQDLAIGGGLELSRVISSTRSTRAAGPMMMPAASGKLTLAAFNGNPLLEPANIFVVESGAPSVPVLLAAADDGAPGNSGFTTFRRDAGNASGSSAAAQSGGRPLGAFASGAGMISGPSGGGSTFQPDALQILQASGTLGDSGSGPGVPGGWHVGATLHVTPLPPAILAFLSGLAALFAFRRARGRAGEPAVG